MMTRGRHGRRALSRRTVLRGLCGGSLVTVGLPTLQSMLNESGTAYAQSPGPLRTFFGTWGWAHGVAYKEKWVPAQTGFGNAWALSETLAALKDVKDHVSVVSGLGGIPFNHGMTVGYMFSGAPIVMTAPKYHVPARPSIDQDVQAAFNAAPGQPKQEVLVVAVCPDHYPTQGTHHSTVSYKGFNSAVPPLSDPRKVFNEIFGGGAPVSPQDPRAKHWPSVLDVVKQDMATLKSKVGAADLSRLDEHFAGISDIERGLSTPPPAMSCQAPATPSSVQKGASTDKDINLYVNDMMARLVTLALSCGRRRVFGFVYGNDTGGVVGNWLGNPFGGNHPLGHRAHNIDFSPTPKEIADALAAYDKITLWTVDALSVLLKYMRNTPDGAGSVLDNAAVLCVSPVHGSHGSADLPILVAGKAGKLKGNVHVRFGPPVGAEGAGRGGNVLRAHLTVLRALGINVTSYGIDAGFKIAPELWKPEYVLRGGRYGDYDGRSLKESAPIPELVET